MLYLSRFIYNYYIVFFKNSAKKAQNRAKKAQKNGIGINRSRFRVRSRISSVRTKLMQRLASLHALRHEIDVPQSPT